MPFDELIQGHQNASNQIERRNQHNRAIKVLNLCLYGQGYLSKAHSTWT